MVGEKRAEKVCCSMFFHQQEGNLKNAPKKSTECRTGGSIQTGERENYNKNQPHFGGNLAGKSLFLWILI